MTPERFRKIEEVFNAATDLPDTERAAALERLCGEDAALRAEVEALLAASFGPTGKIQDAIGREATLMSEETTASIPRRLGAYRLMHEIGQGGMGAVYLAVRDDDEYRTRVAVKLLRRGLESAQSVARFRDERQILATLQHPGIVRLLDGGSTEDGLPYLVMEYVEGASITRWANEHDLTVRERLKLFRRVCAAVAFAHQLLVVHRDLKPSNILVTADGAPKLLDFGIAKLLDPTAGREAETRTGMHLLTPQYASPEQVRGEPVSTATDVYALGAVLYELLSGAPAQRIEGDGIEALRAVLEVEPMRPSLAAPPALRRVLAGDLDNIVMKALQKEPARRYASVEQLAADLGRHLDGLPVQARAGTWTYRAGKMLRRNLGVAAALGIVLASLSTATVISMRQARRADEQARRAQRRFDEVRRLANSLLFEIDGKIQDLEGSTAARELIVSRALEYLDGIAREAGGEDASLSRELAAAYIKIGDIQGNYRMPNLGRPRDGLASYARARQILERIFAAPHADTASRWAMARARVKAGTALLRLDEFEAAREETLAGLTLIRPIPMVGSYDYRLAAEAHLSLYELEGRAGNPGIAMSHAEAFLDVTKRWLRAEPASPEVRYWMGVAQEVLGHGRIALGDPDESVRAFEQSAAVFARLLSEQPENVAYRRELQNVYSINVMSLSGLGQAMGWWPNRGDFAGAEQQLRKALVLAERAVERDAEDIRAREELFYAQNLLATIVARRDPGAAVPLFAQARKSFAEFPESMRRSPQAAQCERALHCAMAESLARLGRRAEAIQAAGRGLAVDVAEAQVEQRWGRWACRYQAARARHVLGDREEAVRLLQEAAEGLRKEIAAQPANLAPRIGLVETLEFAAAVRPQDRCVLLDEAASVWRAWPGKPTPYSIRRLAEIDSGRAGCGPK